MYFLFSKVDRLNLLTALLLCWIRVMLSCFPNLQIWTGHSGCKLFIPFFPRENTLYCAARNATHTFGCSVFNIKSRGERACAQKPGGWKLGAARGSSISEHLLFSIYNKTADKESHLREQLSHSRKFHTQKADPGIFFHLFRVAIFFFRVSARAHLRANERGKPGRAKINDQ